MIITDSKSLKIYCNCLEISSVNLMAKSFVNDLSKMFRKPSIIKSLSEADIVLKIEKLEHIEEYKIEVSNEKIFITGNDDLGLIFGVYAFEEKILKIPPFYLIQDLKIKKFSELKINNQIISSYPRTRFRGWFINDEDLLSGFKTKGKRKIDYKFYNKIIHPKMMEKIAETALRYRMNLIIPSTLVDITNKNEENLVKICSARGLYISQHHIEPVGVSKFGFENYAKEHGFSTEFSYVSNKENIEKCWKFYLQKWSKYPRVIFQVGLRGGLDRPVWVLDKNVSDNFEERGKLISDAIDKQVSLIDEIYPYEKYISTTLWMEGADLIKNGYLNVNKQVQIIFSDIGLGQVFGDDFFTLPRKEDTKYGVYYHAGFCHMGPHLTEGVLPRKMEYCYNLANKYNTNYYSILNVANIKELLFSIYINSRLVWNINDSLDTIIDEYCSLFFDKEKTIEFKNAIEQYFSGLKDVGEIHFKNFCEKNNFSYHKYDNLDFPIVSMTDYMFASLIKGYDLNELNRIITPFIKTACEESLKIMNEVYLKFSNLRNSVAEEYKIGFGEHFVYQSLFWIRYLKAQLYFYDALEQINLKNKKEAKNLLDKSSLELQGIIKDRKQFYIYKYKNWFNEEKKVDIKYLTKGIYRYLN